ncbi:MAG: ATP-binding protein [Pseudomonadota bacterium]|nr:ATP-binding protein [Pseudomonadota bacterium]
MSTEPSQDAGRQKEREGRHVSVGGAAADEVLDSLVQQFADRYAFIRELIQNSLDAGAARIDVRMSFDGRELRIEVADDGEGMDRPIIEGYLLTLFRSTKEDDLTKIGKFGIGFTSIFAMEPMEVVVDTGRDAVWHRVTFDSERSYTLSRLAEPFEGTTVTLRMPRGRKAATVDVQEVRAAAERWCRYADAAITLSATGTDEEWEPTPVAATFSVEAPVVIVDESDGVRAVLGPHPSRTPPAGFYNRGITLWEGEESAVPGVCFRVAGRHLEHTLTRDNVIRDRHYEVVLARIREAARTRLGAAVHAEAEAAARAGDLPRIARLYGAIAEEVPWSWREDAPLLPGHGRPLSLADLRATKGWMARLRGAPSGLWWAPPGCPLAEALTTSGTVVLLARAADDPHLAFAARLLGAAHQPASAGWSLASPVVAPEPLAAMFACAGALVPARLHGDGFFGRVAVSMPSPAGGLVGVPLPDPRARDTLLVDVTHPLVSELGALPTAIGAPLLLHAARVSAGLPGVDPKLVDALSAALVAASLSAGGAPA